MIESFIEFVSVHILPLGAFGVFAGAVLEEIIAPIPSTAIVTAAGFLFLEGPTSAALVLKLVAVVALPAALGITVGSLFVYYILYFGGKALCDRFGKYVGLSWADIERIEGILKKSRRDEAAVVALRAVPIVPSVALSAFCGLVQMPVKKYMLLTFCGTFVRSLVLGTIGWKAGGLYEKHAAQIVRYEDIVFFFIIVAAALFLAYVVSRRKRQA